ncbi:hypothetical protein L873DRAFT_304154 [Choiromyces venosus 120613-1]|uniref:Uncharacterized protein n=1 Tax=Choiromyces venosus 120613-1 TaxID=1336337 RepID=A0A3N4J039_9PEZI|nr:hypothetical protein L873DRAFT_304154 [Choiromyces venosus 120613-1]
MREVGNLPLSHLSLRRCIKTSYPSPHLPSTGFLYISHRYCIVSLFCYTLINVQRQCLTALGCHIFNTLRNPSNPVFS